MDVSERSTTSINLVWANVNENWEYILHINGTTRTVSPAANHQPYSVKLDLEPGTEYPFSVITTFFGLNSTAYENFTVTRMYCTCCLSDKMTNVVYLSMSVI